MKTKDFDTFWNKDSGNYQDLIRVIDRLKTEITEDMKESEDDAACIQITISNNRDCTTWSYQSGDNSYSGGCYGDPYWGVDYVSKDINSEYLAKQLIDDLSNQIEFED